MFIALLWLFFATEQIQACDVCTAFAGINPHDYKSWFTVRYRQSVFSQTLFGNPSSTTFTPYQFTVGRLNHYLATPSTDVSHTFLYKEVYNTFEMAGNIYLSPKWQLFSQLKMSDNSIYYDDSVAVNIAGIGDLLLMARYQVFATKVRSDDTLDTQFKHRLRVGGGIILPTGNYRKYSTVGYETSFTAQGILTVPVQVLDYELQPGAGAVSFPVSLNYLAKYKKVGAYYMANFAANTVSSLGYRFANRFSQMFNIMYFAGTKKFRVILFAGITYETAGKDKLKNVPVMGTGGEAVLLNEGVQFYLQNISLSATLSTPIYQNLWDNQANMQYRATISVKYFINK